MGRPKNLEECDLTAEQASVFLRAIRYYDFLAGRIANEHLDNGATLNEVFATDDDGFGFFIKAKRTDHNRFDIEFGCVAGLTEGDGGEWTVEFAPTHTHDGRSASRIRWMSGGPTWIS